MVTSKSPDHYFFRSHPSLSLGLAMAVTSSLRPFRFPVHGAVAPAAEPDNLERPVVIGMVHLEPHERVRRAAPLAGALAGNEAGPGSPIGGVAHFVFAARLGTPAIGPGIGGAIGDVPCPIFAFPVPPARRDTGGISESPRADIGFGAGDTPRLALVGRAAVPIKRGERFGRPASGAALGLGLVRSHSVPTPCLYLSFRASPGAPGCGTPELFAAACHSDRARRSPLRGGRVEKSRCAFSKSTMTTARSLGSARPCGSRSG